MFLVYFSAACTQRFAFTNWDQSFAIVNGGVFYPCTSGIRVS